MVMRYLLVVLVSIFISSCNSNQAALSMRDGNNTIKGTAFLRQKGGGIVTCAGYKTQLIPYTDYANEIMRATYGNSFGGYVGYYSIDRNRNYFNYQTTAMCDVDGRFVFNNISDGDYFITATVVWKVRYVEGGRLMKRVTVSGGEIKEVFLTH